MMQEELLHHWGLRVPHPSGFGSSTGAAFDLFFSFVPRPPAPFTPPFLPFTPQFSFFPHNT